MYCWDTTCRGKHLWSLLSASREGNKQVCSLFYLAFTAHKVSMVLRLRCCASPVTYVCLGSLVLTSAIACKICWVFTRKSSERVFPVNRFKARSHKKRTSHAEEWRVALRNRFELNVVWTKRCIQMSRESEMLSKNIDFCLSLSHSVGKTCYEVFFWKIEDCLMGKAKSILIKNYAGSEKAVASRLLSSRWTWHGDLVRNRTSPWDDLQ